MKKKVLFAAIVLVLLSGAAFAIFNGMKSMKSEENNSTNTTVNENKKNAKKPAKNREYAFIDKHATVSEITSEEGVVNIYMFWGDGCPHCEKQWEYLDDIAKAYPNDFKVYGFELWYTKSNKEVLDKFAAAVGDEKITAVPYTVIGNKGFKGTISKGNLIDLIQTYKDQDIDIFFDKINQ